MLLISLLGLGFMVGIFLIQFPRFGTWIETLKQQNELIWIEGKICGYDLEQSELILVQVHLIMVKDKSMLKSWKFLFQAASSND